jgi:hypothetical protein
VPAAVDERAVADGLLEGATPAGLLLDRGFLRRARAADRRDRGMAVVYAHSRAERRQLPPTARRPVAAVRNRVETTIGELTDPDALGLARHRARAFRGLLTRAAGSILAHALRRPGLV